MLYQASTIGIVAVGVGMLMIGGEFDLSAGVHRHHGRLVQRDVLLPVGHQPLGRRAAVAGLLPGDRLPERLSGGADRHPSFLITLGTFFVLQGANLGVTKLVTGSVSTPNISQMDGYDSLKAIFASNFTVGGVTFRITVFWWIALRRAVGLGPAAHQDR